jgi:glyoxylase-like metal-dependent hydrolase (beta-lactamase superfamily II)
VVFKLPGHSQGSVAYYSEADKTLFSGDTLFRGSIGRTDFKGGDEQSMIKSLACLSKLPDDTIVYPGHGPSTTIGFERNFYLS